MFTAPHDLLQPAALLIGKPPRPHRLSQPIHLTLDNELDRYRG